MMLLSIIENCDISGNQYVGGIYGYSYRLISYSYVSNSKIFGTNATSTYVGGFSWC